MFLRILEILSGMKWNIWGLLLISVLFCISADPASKPECKRNPNKPPCALVNAIISPTQSNSGNREDVEGIFILGTDRFMGYMKKGDSNWNVKYFM